MIRFVVKLAIVGLLANAVWRVGGLYASHLRFTDAVQQAAHYRGDKSDTQMHDRVFALASQYDIPIDDDTLSITHENNRTLVDGEYKRSVELVPGFVYKWPFKIHIDAPTIDPLKVDTPIR